MTPKRASQGRGESTSYAHAVSEARERCDGRIAFPLPADDRSESFWNSFYGERQTGIGVCRRGSQRVDVGHDLGRFSPRTAPRNLRADCTPRSIAEAHARCGDVNSRGQQGLIRAQCLGSPSYCAGCSLRLMPYARPIVSSDTVNIRRSLVVIGFVNTQLLSRVLALVSCQPRPARVDW